MCNVSPKAFWRYNALTQAFPFRAISRHSLRLHHLYTGLAFMHKPKSPFQRGFAELVDFQRMCWALIAGVETPAYRPLRQRPVSSPQRRRPVAGDSGLPPQPPSESTFPAGAEAHIIYCDLFGPAEAVSLLQSIHANFMRMWPLKNAGVDAHTTAGRETGATSEPPFRVWRAGV